jgi:hypothetical protein
MFGVWTHFNRLIDVDLGTPGSQVLRINRHAQSPSGHSGSHKVFWDFFYEGCNAIAPWVPAELHVVTTPVNNDRAWQIDARNDVNYDTFAAFNAATLLANSFSPKRLRTATGPLAQQLEVTEGMLKLAIYFANLFGVRSFAYQGLGTGERSKVLRSLVTKAPPGLFTQSVLQELLR